MAGLLVHKLGDRLEVLFPLGPLRQAQGPVPTVGVVPLVRLVTEPKIGASLVTELLLPKYMLYLNPNSGAPSPLHHCEFKKQNVFTTLNYENDTISKRISK